MSRENAALSLVARLVVILVIAVAPLEAAVHEYRILQLPDGTRLKHALVLPEGFRPDQTYPVLLALPPGTQSERMVEEGLRRYWGPHAARRGWIVVSPMALAGESFHEGSEVHVEQLLAAVSARYRVEGGRFHLAGASNGGVSAFHVAIEHPELFHSLVVLPGAPQPADEHRLGELREMPVRMFVGGDDGPWVVRSRLTETKLRELGGDVSLEVLRGEGHAPESLETGEVIDLLDELRVELKLGTVAEPPPSAPVDSTLLLPPETEVGQLLDTFHGAAASADFSLYFGCFAEEGIFLGTDASERWTVDEFKAYAKPHFDKGKGWTYVPEDRNVVVDGTGRTAWFDELVRNEKYGLCRGTGVCVATPEGWRIAHYSLTFTIPNEAAGAAMDAVRASVMAEESPD